MKIDAAVHFWKYAKTFQNPLVSENKILQIHFLPEQISQSLHRNGINGCIAINAENTEVETRFLAELALSHPEISAVIGWIDLTDAGAIEKLREFQQYIAIRGYQMVFRKDRLPKPVVMQFLLEHNYALDISLGAGTEPADLADWFGSNMDQQFILQDCASPDATHAPSVQWESKIRELATQQNLSCKVSGLFIHGSWKTWKPADFYPFLDILFDAFGFERMLYASDWPYLLLSGIYVQWKSLLEKFTENFKKEDREKFFGENASRIYRL
jgi:L-fuconolactonase